jgi:hypothetical protein
MVRDLVAKEFSLRFRKSHEAPRYWSARSATGASVIRVFVAGTRPALLRRLVLTVSGPGQPMSPRWAGVVRVQCDSHRIILERIGSPGTVISLWHVSDSDKVHRAIRHLVPNRALQRTGV